MDQPKVSIIVPIYNVEKYLDRCMQSLLNQTLKEIEIILVDDESPDNCPAMCDQYARQDDRIKVIHKKNGGLGFARNSGLEIATGEYVVFIDSDDYVKTEALAALYDIASQYFSDAVYANFYRYQQGVATVPVNEIQDFKQINGENEVREFLFSMIGANPEYPKDRKYGMSVWRALYRLEIIKQNNVVFPSERQYISEDIVFHLEFLSRAKSITLTPENYYYYCLNANSLTSSFLADRFEKYKYLHNALSERLIELYGEDQQSKMSVDRLLIGYVRRYTFAKVNSNLGFTVLLKHISQICNDRYVRNVLKAYPYNKMSIKNRVLLSLIYYRCVFFILFYKKFIA